ncbi:MAG: AmmeMemoRadiSam system protein B, partial [Myxococcota bacterium]
VDQELLGALDLGGLRVCDEPVEPARPDNGTELQLPFVRFFFPTAKLLVLGAAANQSAGTLGERVAHAALSLGRRAVYVGSTDLTHYGPRFEFEPVESQRSRRWVLEDNDRRFLSPLIDGDVEALLEGALEFKSACCPGAVAAAMSAARVSGDLEPQILAHYCSPAQAPNDANFVSYAGAVF